MYLLMRNGKWHARTVDNAFESQPSDSSLDAVAHLATHLETYFVRRDENGHSEYDRVRDLPRRLGEADLDPEQTTGEEESDPDDGASRHDLLLENRLLREMISLQHRHPVIVSVIKDEL